VVSAREEADVGKLASSDQWALTEAEDHQRVWTDDYSNCLAPSGGGSRTARIDELRLSKARL